MRRRLGLTLFTEDSFTSTGGPELDSNGARVPDYGPRRSIYLARFNLDGTLLNASSYERFAMAMVYKYLDWSDNTGTSKKNRKALPTTRHRGCVVC